MHTMTIDGLFNVRGDEPSAPWLVRSGMTEKLTAAGTAELRRLGVTMILDLREPDEVSGTCPGLPVVSVPLFGQPAPTAGRLEDIYDRLLLERGHAFARAVAHVADADGGVLVHCTAGKDRTGLLTALTLAAVGIGSETISADYAQSGGSIRSVRGHIAARIADEADPELREEILRLHLDSPREAIDHALSTLEGLGGSVSYLRRHGLTDEQLAQLRRKAGSGDTAQRRSA